MFNGIAIDGSRICSQNAFSTNPLPKPVAPWTMPAKKAPKSKINWQISGSEINIKKQYGRGCKVYRLFWYYFF